MPSLRTAHDIDVPPVDAVGIRSETHQRQTRDAAALGRDDCAPSHTERAFRSILFDGIQPTALDHLSTPECFPDLNLDQEPSAKGSLDQPGQRPKGPGEFHHLGAVREYASRASGCQATIDTARRLAARVKDAWRRAASW